MDSNKVKEYQTIRENKNRIHSTFYALVGKNITANAASNIDMAAKKRKNTKINFKICNFNGLK
jgi:hypothetical protein